MSELHPSDLVLLAFAAGALDKAQHFAIDEHARGCARCRAFVRALEHVGGIILDDLPPTPLAGELSLFAQLDRHDAMLLPHQGPLQRGGTLRLEPTFSDYARRVSDVEVDFLLTERGKRDWSIRRSGLTNTALQFGRTGASTIADGMADRSDAIVFAIQSSMSTDLISMNGQKASPSDIAVLPPGCDFIFVGRAPHEWVSIILPLTKLPSGLVDRVGEQIERRESALITVASSRCHRLIKVAVRAAKSESQYISVACHPDDSEEELIDELSMAITTAKANQDGLRRHDPHDSYQIVRHVLSAAREGQPVHVADLCHISSIEERTLARAFTNVFNMSPARYLKLRLLNNIHKSLLAPEVRGRQVADILMSGGVIELDEFTTEYRLLFGETPCQTLRGHSQPYN